VRMIQQQGSAADSRTVMQIGGVSGE